MKLDDLQRAMALQGELGVLDKLAAQISAEVPIVLSIGNDAELITPELAQAAIEVQRGRIWQQLRALGVTPEGAAPAPVPKLGRALDDAITHSLVENGIAKPIADRPATMAEARERAKRAVLKGWYDDLEKGIIDQEQFDKYAAKRAADIEQLARDMAGGLDEPGRCAECDEPVSTVIGNIGYCAAHAKAAPRPERPNFIRGVFGR